MQISYHLDLLRSDESSENYENSEKRDPWLGIMEFVYEQQYSITIEDQLAKTS